VSISVLRLPSPSLRCRSHLYPYRLQISFVEYFDNHQSTRLFCTLSIYSKNSLVNTVVFACQHQLSFPFIITSPFYEASYNLPFAVPVLSLDYYCYYYYCDFGFRVTFIPASPLALINNFGTPPVSITPLIHNSILST
jgi:hypothetical protein